MNIVVFGASGRVGSKVVELLLAEHHVVIAAVHEHNPFEGNLNLRVVQLDIHDPKVVAETVQGVDAVISCVSNWGSKEGDVLTAAMKSIVPAMKAHGVKRLISLTGNAAFTPDDEPTLVQKANRAMLHKLAPKVLADGEEHMAVLRGSDLDWTVLRSPVMNNLGSEKYKLSAKLSGGAATINRQAVALALVAQLHDGTWLRQTPTIWRA